MGDETPIPPKMINAAAPEGAPPRRIKTVEIKFCQYSWFECEPDRFMNVSHERFFLISGTVHNFFLTRKW